VFPGLYFAPIEYVAIVGGVNMFGKLVKYFAEDPVVLNKKQNPLQWTTPLREPSL
jgi:hypothetical protein